MTYNKALELWEKKVSYLTKVSKALDAVRELGDWKLVQHLLTLEVDARYEVKQLERQKHVYALKEGITGY